MGMKRTPSKLEYDLAWETERMSRYPVIDAFEERMGFAVDRSRLEAAARVLACPVKKNPPNWQHGRVVYALGRMIERRHEAQHWLDLGTAKGFSAVCMAWAAADGHHLAKGAIVIHSCDIIDPMSNEPRNSIFDGKAQNGILDYVFPFSPENVPIQFSRVGDAEHARFLERAKRIGFAFIDGSHTYEGVKADIATVTPRQLSGDIIMFDDIQVPGVAQAVSEMEGYAIEHIDLLPKRKYAIAVKQ